jgi:hypothetical protein
MTKTRRPLGTVAALAALSLAACNHDHVLGAVDPQTITEMPPPPDGSAPAPTEDAGMPLDCQLAHTWTGYIEDVTFPSGSTVVKMTLPEDGRCPIEGTITFGEGPPLPPVTDPDVGYPPGIAPSAYVTYLAEGNPFHMLNVMQLGAGFRFEVAHSEIWTSWCSMQTALDPGSNTCGHDWTTREGPDGCSLLDPTTNQWTPIDCGKMYLCNRQQWCRCDATGCAVGARPPSEAPVLGTDIKVLLPEVTGDKINGMASGTINGFIHFTRDP